jgi:hypothetical protein
MVSQQLLQRTVYRRPLELLGIEGENLVISGRKGDNQLVIHGDRMSMDYWMIQPSQED